MSQFDKTRIGRRRLFKLGVAAAGGVAGAAVVSGLGRRSGEHAIEADSEGLATWGRGAGTWIPSCCNMCGGQCGINVHIVDGVVEKIEPNNWNPNNYTNISTDWFDGYTEEAGCKEGAVICPKGNSGIMALYDPDRLEKPLKRTNPDKTIGADPKWQELTWDQALDEIAARLKALRDAGEAHKLLWFSEDHSFTHPQQDFCALFGTPNYSNHSNLCDVSRKASFGAVMGDGRPLADFIQSKYILLFGWNPTSAIKWVHLPRIITRAVENGAKMVVVDPYMSDTAAKAQEWVPIRPSTDGAMALAMGHVIIREELHDREFIDKWSVGFDEYAAYVSDKTPEWAEEITGVKAATIERLAIELATTKPALVDVWSGPGQHSNGVQGGRAIALLNVLIGSVDTPGGMINPDKVGPKHASVEPDEQAAATRKAPRFDELTKYPLGHSSGVYTQSFTNLLEGEGPYQPKMAVVVFQNLVMSVPGGPKVAEALAKLETLVVIDTMLSETAMQADYVLPGTVYLERYDLNSHWVTWSVVGLRQPVVKPRFGQPTEYETVAALGRRLGLKDKSGKEFFSVGAISSQPIEDLTAWYEEQLSNELKNGGPKITLDELKALPGAVWVDTKGTTYRKYESPLSAETLATAVYEGDPNEEGVIVYDKPKDDGGKAIGVIVDGRPVKGFGTASRKLQFVAKDFAGKVDAAGKPLNPLPAFEPRDWQPTDEYPLFLINWKEASHTHTRTFNNAWLLDLKPENPLIVHPDTAELLGLQEGDRALIESPYGRTEAKVKVSRRMHPEVVGLQHGFGHWAMGELAKGRGTADSILRPTKADPLSGQALHKENCVRVSKL
jgi:thiosulfate reductase/polysulfide reductase chain A